MLYNTVSISARHSSWYSGKRRCVLLDNGPMKGKLQLTLREKLNIRHYKRQDTEQSQSTSTAPPSVRHMRDKTTKSLPSKIVT
jgi:hypothetical protein